MDLSGLSLTCEQYIGIVDVSDAFIRTRIEGGTFDGVCDLDQLGRLFDEARRVVEGREKGATCDDRG